ncbi:hypothetical protein ACWEF9_25715 [Streptomyces sp. NPDC004980]
MDRLDQAVRQALADEHSSAYRLAYTPGNSRPIDIRHCSNRGLEWTA